jgi:hypothetical protein
MTGRAAFTKSGITIQCLLVKISKSPFMIIPFELLSALAQPKGLRITCNKIQKIKTDSRVVNSKFFSDFGQKNTGHPSREVGESNGFKLLQKEK